ncbi:alanine--tRNA ligase [Fervidicoccus sp.]|uniref:alanine--tRNA ligase n=1 Tax=Fervidicoccus sp. TaxID=2060324 RepID=UPI003D1016EB
MVQVNPEEYLLNFFKENGFVRKRCKKCGEYFWTLNTEFDTCQDAPCVEYFFDSIPVKRPLSVREARQTFLTFFEKRGHKILDPRPVVARWREDLYLTIASIVLFQPHVTSGLVPPPANPLVVSQPCIRLEDIDNVGLTMGRHLTLFEMGGHHAFNERNGKFIYWKDETVRYSFEFFTKEIGIPPELLVFKESWWEGGGNAGPSFEVTVGGLEPATLVFMQYKKNGNNLEPIPLQIVDTGYGIERIAWFTQKTPTAFHAIYGDLVNEFRKKLGLEEPPKEYYKAAFRYVGLLDPSSEQSVSMFIKNISKHSGFDEESVKAFLQNDMKLFTILDHSKTLAYMLGDGIVPSNQGEGYLARLVLRRALRTLYLINLEIDFTDFIEKQIEYWKQDNYKLKEFHNYIINVVQYEQKKFYELVKEKIPKLLQTVVSNPSFETFEKIYKEQGIPPELIVNEAKKKNISIEVPFDFYSKIARESSRPKLGKKQEVTTRLEWLNNIPPTELLFHVDPYLRESDAKILAAKENMLVLDKTIFYPLGGGQSSDKGSIEVDGKIYNVVNVEKYDEHVIHYLDKNIEKDAEKLIGSSCKLKIDWSVRYLNMRHHTSTHILLGVLRKVLGQHVWQAGAEKTPEKARLDVTHYEVPDPATIRRIEDEANKVVLERLPVITKFMDKNEAEERYGFVLYQGGVPMSKRIRIVEIPGHDVEACFGTHVSNTGEVGGIKIINVAKLQDGIIRFEFVSGTQVTNYASKLESILNEVSKEVETESPLLLNRVKKLNQEFEQMKNRLNLYRDIYSEVFRENLKSKAEVINGIRLFVYKDEIDDEEFTTELLKEITREMREIIVIRIFKNAKGTSIEVSEGRESSEKLNATEIIKALSSYGCKGGGKKDHAQCTSEQEINVDDVWKMVKELLEKKG